MKKQFIAFCLILSFVFPLFLSFPVSVSAYTVSGNEVTVSGDEIDDFLNDLMKQTVQKVGENGLVAFNAFWEWGTTPVTDNFLSYYADSIGLDSLNTTARDIALYCFMHNYSVDYLVTSYGDAIIADIEDKLPYFIYHTIPIDKFFSFYNFSNYSGMSTTLGNFKTALESICSNSDNFYFLTDNNRSGMHYLYDANLFSVSSNYLENYALVLYSGAFSIFPEKPYQSIVVRSGDSVPSFNLNGRLKFYNGLDFADTSSFDYWLSTSRLGGNDFDGFIKTGPLSVVGQTPSDISLYCGVYNNGTGWFSNNSWQGSGFITVDPQTLLIFKSGSDLNTFYSGNSKFYQFDSDIDLSKYPGIDYSKLYDIISQNLDSMSGSLGDKLDQIADEFLKKQIQLLGDIRDSLKDPDSGFSWLRLIHNILSDNFDIKLSDLLGAINNLSFSGGGSLPQDVIEDIDSINSHLANIEAELQLQNVDQILSDFENDPNYQATKDDLVAVMKTKFPFSVVSDVEIICRVFDSVEMKPDWQFNIPYTNDTFTIDLSFYEDYLKDYVQAFLILLFIIFLMTVSIRIISFLA